MVQIHLRSFAGSLVKNIVPMTKKRFSVRLSVSFSSQDTVPRVGNKGANPFADMKRSFNLKFAVCDNGETESFL